MRKGGRYRRSFVGRTYQTGGKEPGMHMIAWRFVQIAIEGSVQMGRKEEIAVGWQIEEDMIPADPTMIEARAQLKWHGRQWHDGDYGRSEEHTSELQSLMSISYAVFCLKKKRGIRHI